MVMRRMTARERRVGEIDPEIDIRVALIGKAKDVKGDRFKLEDDSGEVEVFSEDKNLKNDKFIRVIGKINKEDDSFNLKGEIIQDFSNFDINLYKKVSKILKER